MASTYVNNLRLEEMATGEQSGTWGTKTNTNLELIGQAVAWGTRAIANASTDNITIADGAADADRCLGLKLTGGGQACTVTLLPNTSSKTWVMYNATSYTLTFTCGSGANVAILAGETKMIATDGLGSGGVVHDLLTSVNLAGTTKTAALTNAGTSTLIGVTTHGDDVVSDTDSTDDLGTTGVRWANLFVDAITATDQVTATGFTGTLDGILGSGAAAAATVTTLNTTGAVTFNDAGADVDFRVESDGDANMLFVDGGGNKVGIGTATPGFTVEVVGGTNDGIHIKDAASATVFGGLFTQSAALALVTRSNHALAFGSNDTTRMTITNAGLVGIGLTAPVGILNVKGTGGDAMPATSGSTQSAGLITRLQQGGGIGSVMDIGGNGGSGSWIQVTEGGDLSTNYKLLLNPNGGNVGIGLTAPAELLHLSSSSDAGIRLDKSSVVATRIKSVSTALAFFADTSSGTTERMRIEGVVGRIGIGTTDTTGLVNIWLNNAYYGMILQNVAGNTGALSAIRFNNSAGTQQGLVSHNGSGTTTYGTTSDYRLKENVEYNWNATTELKKLKPAKFNFIEDPSKTIEGFLAHEVEDIVPLAVVGKKDAVDKNGSVDPQSIDQSKLVPMLVKTILELEARITALEG